MKTIVKPLCAIVMGASVLTGCGHDASYSKIKKSGTLVVGMQANYAPFSYYKDGKLTGYDVDVARLVAKKLGLKIKFRTMDNDRLVKELDSGKIDMTGNQQEIVYKTLDADTQVPYYFSTPYKYSRLVVVTRKSNTTIKHFDDQRNQKVAMSRGDFFEDSVLSDGGDIVNQKDFDTCMKAVENKKAVDTMNDLLAFQYYMKKHPQANLKGSVLSANIFPLTFMVKGTDQTLATKIDKAVMSLQNAGTLSKLSMKYFYQDISKEK